MVPNFLVSPAVKVADSRDLADISQGMVSVALGAVIAQFSLLVLAAVFGPWKIHFRLSAVFAVLCAFVVAFLIGYAIAATWWPGKYAPRVREVIGVFLCTLPSGFLAALFPMWIVKRVGRWRLAPPENAYPSTNDGWRFLVAAITTVGIAVATIEVGTRLANDRGTHLWFETALLSVCLALLTVAVLPATVIFVFRGSNPARRVAIWFLTPIVAAIFLLALAWMIAQEWPGSLASPFLTVTVAAAGIVGPLFLIRSYGYRLLWGREVS